MMGPHDARMSTQRRETASFRGRGPNGLKLCYCGCGREAKPPRRNWFSQACVNAWKERNDIQTIRKKVFARDKGICAECGFDTVAAQRLACETRILPPGFDWFSRADWWQADHIVPVVEGGGQCGLDGYRTLCCRCHKRETAKLAKRRAQTRRAVSE